ncbi:MAG: DegT/DnrJ/EryC1/StrS family aminotransferase [Candidatus Chisholmbacteria bacterium]|nr:DegT/DnrJ/EryC1/StrS family aminotransferase [Candidatus Chisholmbacteria bacterium]
MKIEFVDLKRQNRLHRKEFLQVIEKIMAAASFSLGPTLEKFEKAFARFVGAKYCIGLNSGTDAIEFSLKVHDIGPGDEVITAPNSYFSTAMVVSKLGAKPVFADVNPHTYTIDPDQIKKKITPKTKAIIPIHLYGQPADIDPILAIARKHRLIVIEDCCQAHGTKYKGKTVPVSGIGAFSFYPGKNLGGFGDGGALVTNSRHLATLIKKLRNDGSITKYHHELIGSKSRLDTLQAAVLSTKLKYLTQWNKLRRRHASLYSRLLTQISGVLLPQEAPYSYHNYHLYVIEVPHRDQLQRYLSKKGISTVIHYPTPIHLQPAYKHLGYKRGDFPITEKTAKRILSLPMFPELTDKEIHFVVQHIKQFLAEVRAQ